jgi:hypothetical protein
MGSRELEKLYRKVDRCSFCKIARNPLRHIHGFGAMRPKLMLVLVNPTYRNLSSAPDYKGLRFPFIGVRHFWRVLADGGLISKKVAYDLPLPVKWKKEDTEKIKRELVENKLFLTNVVKCCYNHSEYPQKQVVKSHLNLLEEEIGIVKPRRIVAFGGLVYKTLTKSLKLEIPLISCYFPVGRGRPREAARILREIR